MYWHAEGMKSKYEDEIIYNGGNGYGNIKLYSKHGKKIELIDDIEVSHVGCEYGEFDKK